MEDIEVRDLRCEGCKKLLGRAEDLFKDLEDFQRAIEIKCPRCHEVNKFKV